MAILLFSVTLLLQPISSVWTNLLSELDISANVTHGIINLFGGLIILILAISAFKFVKEKRKISKVDISFLLFGLIALSSFFWRVDTAPSFLLGIRYSIFAISGYFIGRAFFLNINYWDKILRFLFWFIILISGAQLLIYIFGGGSSLAAIGFNIEHFAGSWPRLNGPFPGPNQLATFLTITALWLYWRQKISLQNFILASIIVVFTFSRSAILGLVVGYLVPFIFIQTKKEKRLNISTATIGVLLLATASVYFIEPLRNNFINLRNTDERVVALQTSYDRFSDSSFLQLSFGHGTGTAGPASVFSDAPLLSENWLIQTGYEYGFIGLLLLMAGWFYLAYWGYKNNRPWLVAIVLAMFINSLFLHPLSDNFPAAIWFYLLLGVGFSEINRVKEVNV